MARRSLAGGHLVGPATLAAARPGRGQAGAGALDDELALELGQGGEDAEHELACSGGCVDRGTLAGQDPQAHPATGQLVHQVDQVPQIAAEAVELPRDEHVTLLAAP